MIAVLVMGVALITPAHARKKAPTFDQVYEVEVTKANAALKAYANTSCTADNFPDVANAFTTEAVALTTLFEAIPDNEDQLVQARQVEIYSGFIILSQTVANMKSDCGSQKDSSSPVYNSN